METSWILFKSISASWCSPWWNRPSSNSWPQDLFGPSMHVKVGCDARDVLRPSDPKETKASKGDNMNYNDMDV